MEYGCELLGCGSGSRVDQRHQRPVPDRGCEIVLGRTEYPVLPRASRAGWPHQPRRESPSQRRQAQASCTPGAFRPRRVPTSTASSAPSTWPGPPVAPHCSSCCASSAGSRVLCHAQFRGKGAPIRDPVLAANTFAPLRAQAHGTEHAGSGLGPLRASAIASDVDKQRGAAEPLELPDPKRQVPRHPLVHGAFQALGASPVAGGPPRPFPAVRLPRHTAPDIPVARTCRCAAHRPSGHPSVSARRETPRPCPPEPGGSPGSAQPAVDPSWWHRQPRPAAERRGMTAGRETARSQSPAMSLPDGHRQWPQARESSMICLAAASLLAARSRLSVDIEQLGKGYAPLEYGPLEVGVLLRQRRADLVQVLDPRRRDQTRPAPAPPGVAARSATVHALTQAPANERPGRGIASMS